MPPADPNLPCRQEVFNISSDKLNRDNEAGLIGALAPHDQAVAVVGQVLVLSDPSVFFTINSRDQQEFDAKRAFQAVKTRAGDKFDCVAFFIDRRSGLPNLGNYSVSVHNSVRGINHFKGDSYSQRGEWGTTRLLACQIISLRNPDFRTCLH